MFVSQYHARRVFHKSDPVESHIMRNTNSIEPPPSSPDYCTQDWSNPLRNDNSLSSPEAIIFFNYIIVSARESVISLIALQ